MRSYALSSGESHIPDRTAGPGPDHRHRHMAERLQGLDGILMQVRVADHLLPDQLLQGHPPVSHFGADLLCILSFDHVLCIMF